MLALQKMHIARKKKEISKKSEGQGRPLPNTIDHNHTFVLIALSLWNKKLEIRNLWTDAKAYAGYRLACRSPICRCCLHRLLFQSCRCFRVAALSGHAALALSPNGIAPVLNKIQLSAICRGGQSGKVIDLLAWRCLPLGHPSAASGACAVVQKSPSKRQWGKPPQRQAILKAAIVCHSNNFSSTKNHH